MFRFVGDELPYTSTVLIEKFEQEGDLRRVFAAAYANYRNVLRWQFNLNLLQYGHSFLTTLLPTMIIARDVLSGELEVGRAIQAAGAFAAILSALTVIVQNFESLSRFSAGVDRLHAFSQALDETSAQPAKEADTQINMVHGLELSMKNVTVYTPNRAQMLVEELSLAVKPGASLLIVGPSGAGKSSLLRVVAGLWNTGSGDVVRPGGADMLFLPQQPYLPLGDLRCQLTYPDTERVVSDDQLQRWLERVNLPDLAARFGGLDAQLDWSKVLSVGEQQRLAFARALLIQPRYLLLDESTSALDERNEELLYGQLAGLAVTAVSVSHHRAIARHHRHVLELHGDGGWALHEASKWSDQAHH